MNNIFHQVDSQQPIDIAVLGAYNVGKTTLVQKFSQQLTPQNIFHTIGIEFTAKTFLHRNKKFRLKFWDSCKVFFQDIAGDPKYHNLAIQSIQKASAILLVYDITSYASFHEANEWINQLYELQKDLPILLYGNKHDLLFQKTIMKNQKRQVTQKEGRQLADKVDGVWIEGCGKTDNNLEKGLRLLLDRYFMDDNIILESTQVKPGCCCC